MTTLTELVAFQGPAFIEQYQTFCDENRTFEPVNPFICEAVRNNQLATPWMQEALRVTEARFPDLSRAESQHAALQHLLIEGHWALVTHCGAGVRPAGWRS